MLDFARARDWQPPADWRRLHSLELHTGGEPLRVILSGWPPPPGATLLERRRHVREIQDDLRRALMWEPRGHADMYGCLIVPPHTPGADFGVLFMHNEGLSSMCGHGIIAVVTAVLETGMLPATGPETCVRIDAPAGLITAWARVDGGRVRSVRFRNVPAYVAARDARVVVPGIGELRYDLVWGGAYYAYVDAADAGVGLAAGDVAALIERGRAIKHAVAAVADLRHPFEPDLGFLYGTIFVGPPQDARHHSRNVCVFADGEVDRSPTGTGVSGRCALLFARGDLALHETIAIESIVGSTFRVRAVEALDYGGHAAVVPEVEGSAHICGRSEFLLDPTDPFVHGFLLR